MNEQLKVILSLNDDEAIKAWEQSIRRIINLDMQFKALPPHVLTNYPRRKERTERDYLTEYLQLQRLQMYKDDVTKGFIKNVW